MDVTKINPFFEATCQVFNTMLGCMPKKGQAKIASEDQDQIMRTAIIGFTGTENGAVALSFPAATATSVVKKMLGIDQVGPDVNIDDALGEMANMVAGVAKAKLHAQQISISLPTVVKGKRYAIVHPKDSVTIAVPFDCELGGFTLNVTFSKPRAHKE